MEAELADIIIRSRATILEILDSRGYDVSLYRNIAPDQLLILADKGNAASNSRALDIFVPKKEGDNIRAPCARAVVVHVLHDRIKHKLPGFTELPWAPVDGKETTKIEQTDDIIVIVNEPWHENFDKESLRLWQSMRVRMTFFPIKQIVVNPSRHILVPPHRKLTSDEAEEAMSKWHVTSKLQLPQIKMSDIQAKVLGMVPGDIVLVERPSATAGISRILRNCSA